MNRAIAALSCVLAGGSCHVDEAPDAPEPRPPQAIEPRASADSEDGLATYAARAAERMEHEARAGERDESDDVVGASEPLPPAEALERAKALYAEGTQAYEEADYVRASRKFEESYAYAPDMHALAYNIAKAHRMAGDCCASLRWLGVFLERAPQSPAHEEARRMLDDRTCPCDGP